MAHKLARVENRLRRHLARGWDRAVFAHPQTDDDSSDPLVIEGPGPGDVEDEDFVTRRDAAFESLMKSALDAAQEGRVKQTYVIDPVRQVRVDARHGHAKVRERDEESLRKTMGGKDRPLRPDTSADLLRAIGIMNPDGSISARNAKKYKQVNHLVELCRPIWQHVLETRDESANGPLRVLDLACGNSYLDFVLMHALRLENIPVRVVGIDARAELVERSSARAHALGFSGDMEFVSGTIAESGMAAIERLGGPPEIVVALHACDTATDEALALAIRVRAAAVLVAPCCQAELARQLQIEESSDGPALTRHGLLRRSYADLITDGLRVDTLEACGYAVSVLEFVDSEHTPKNLLIRARLAAPQHASAEPFDLRAVAERCAQLGVSPTLLRLLDPSARPASEFSV